MKRFFRFLLLGLILLTVAMGSALTAMRFAIHGREVEVPKLIGMTRSTAETSANASGLILEVENKFFSSDVAEGKILSQLPTAGSRVRRGWKIRAAQSLGPQRTEIPSVIGQSVRAAEINVRRRGLEVGSIAVGSIPGATVDQILVQYPPPNAGALESPKISVLVAAEEAEKQFVMPNFVGKHFADVAAQIGEAGFSIGKVTDAAPAAGAPAAGATQSAAMSVAGSGVIVKQIPAAGQKIAAGATVSFEVSH
jgi:beta-lactam-binding protein with PASTA domain